MRYLAIDYGSRRTGLAVCDANEMIASPLEVVSDKQDLFAHVVQQISRLEIGGIVIGLPFNMDGTEGFQARAVRTFGRELAAHVDIPIHYQDERLSSYAAWEKRPDMRGGRKKKGKPMDALAAAEILTTFLEMKNEALSCEEDAGPEIGDPL